jgi:hypothetical protein
MSTVSRAQVLTEMEMRETANKKRVFYSMQFYKENGEVVTVPRAHTCGLAYNMRDNRQRGVQPVDVNGKKSGHVYPVSIDNIREFNGMRIKI